MHARALKRLDLETELRRALERRELAIHYQPICHLRSRRPVAFEALVRWNHPERGLLPASAFVPFAESAGILGDIDGWVVGEACRMARLFPTDGSSSPLQVHVNLSPSRLHDASIASQVEAALEESGLEPVLLTLEITEGAVLGDARAAEQQISRLKSLGVRLALDDFGTGYSSLNYVRRFPVDAVKVDRVFIDGLALDRGTAALVQAVVKLGHGLSLDVIAEGIEQPAQIESLLDLECRLGQGWLLSRPLPEEDLEAYLQESRRS